MGSNPFNVPREQQTFLGMMDNFFENLSNSIDRQRKDIQAEEEAYNKTDSKIEGAEPQSQEIHVHIHTGAAAKKDPNAKVRNRGKVVFPAGSKKVSDDKDHFPINDANQARNALSRVAQYSAVPSWYSGSLSELQSAVRSAVKRAYPDVKVTEPKKK